MNVKVVFILCDIIYRTIITTVTTESSYCSSEFMTSKVTIFIYVRLFSVFVPNKNLTIFYCINKFSTVSRMSQK